ncbi:tripartite tricarboxylate transporter TctB family protein [Limnohabitans sp.]|jgi:hypothetical protein|uniref:tripartite tricarboxylate transporter TctB family protein n=1 Tax=Limnohabitans sp. TaxID=1907725 RepID=UPI0037C1AD2E
MNSRLSGLMCTLFFVLLGGGQMYLAPRLAGGLGLNAAEPGPGLFPMMTGALMFFSAATLLIQMLPKVQAEEATEYRSPRDIILLVAAIALYIFLLPRAGFFIAAFLLLLSALTIFDMPNLWRRLLTAALATVISYGVFTLGLSVNMPNPTWFN